MRWSVPWLPALLSLVSVGCSSSAPTPAWRGELSATAVHVVPDAVVAEADTRWTWQPRARLPAPYRQVGDLVSTPRGLVIAASVDALERDGAAIFRLDPDDSLVRLFQWGGQGFLRVAAFGDRLFVPDGDPPFHLFDYVFSWDVDGYVFVSDAEGRFDADWKEVLPASYHVFDVARLQGARSGEGLLVASTGAYPKSETAYWTEFGPAVLFADAGPGQPWRRLLEYPFREATGVTRFTWLQPLPDGALLAGLQSSRPDVPHAVRIEGLGEEPRVTEVSGLPDEPARWFTWGDRVFALTWRSGDTRSAGPAGQTTLSVSLDSGRSFTPVAGAPESPQALATVGDALYLLAGGALHRSTDGEHFTRVSEPSPGLGEGPTLLASPPLVAHAGSLWAANPRTGEILQAVPMPP